MKSPLSGNSVPTLVDEAPASKPHSGIRKKPSVSEFGRRLRATALAGVFALLAVLIAVVAGWAIASQFASAPAVPLVVSLLGIGAVVSARGSSASDSEPITVSAREAAALLGVSEKTLWSMTAPRGDIPVVRMGRRVLYSIESLRRFVAEQEAATRRVDSED